MLSIHKEALKRKPKLIRYYQPGVRGFEDFLASQTEHNFRVRDRATPAATPAISKPARIQNQPETQIPRILITDDRWHKWSALRVTVSNFHLPGQDPTLASDYAATITEGYAKAKLLYAAYIAAFPDIPTGLVRVLVEVHGGYYKENVVFDASYIDVVGIGYPIITADPEIVFIENISAVVTIKSTCEQIIFDGFEVYNGVLMEGNNWFNALGLCVEEGNDGVDAASFESSIQLKNLIFEGGGTQMYVQRRVTGWNVRTSSADNYTNPFATEASVVERFCLGTAGGVGPLFPQRMWSQWYGCHFSGQSVNTGETIKRGKAFSAYALKADLSTWIPNTTTMGGIPPESDDFYCKSGVYFHDCRFEGWTENKGWAMEFDSCKNIQGMWINDTGSGGVHHLMQSNTDIGCEAYTWFTGGTEVDCNYLCFFSDTNVAAPTARCIAWLRNMIHACPTLPQPPGGGTAMGATSFGAQGKLFGLQSATSLGWFFGPAGVVDTGVLTNCSSGKANSLSNTAGIQNIQMRQGYQNYR